MDPKPALESRTLWVNGLTIAAMLLTWAAGQEWVKAYPWLVGVLPIALAAVNIGLRFLADKPIEINPSPPNPVDPVKPPVSDHPILDAITHSIAVALADGTLDISDLTKSLPEILAAIRAKREQKNAA